MARKTPGAARGTQMFTKLANGASTEFDLISETLKGDRSKLSHERAE